MLMRKCQWLHVALLSLCFALPAPSWALGLGEIDVTSALNERFVGTIEVLDGQGFQESEIVVSMASRDDFARVGVERFFYLTNLKFSVDTSGNSAVINVTSSQPVAEPYLNFIVEVLWPRGRLLKEYTVLLDPPTFSQAAAPAVSAPSQTVAQTPAQQPEAASQPATRVNLQPSASPRAARRAPVEGLMTSRDDTLWKIAKRTLPSDAVSINQHMLAIQRKNPEAFMRGNINLLKAGYVLDIPTENEALGITNAQANMDVAAQTADWRDGRSTQVASSDSGATALVDNQATPELASQVSATDSSSASSTSAGETEGQVRIVASTGELASGTAAGDDPTVNQLIEEKETLSREVDELTYQLDREKEIATNQVAVKERQLEVKDQELAAAQQQMKELREQLAEAAQNQNQNTNPTPAEETPIWMSPLVLGSVIGVLVLVLVYALFALRKTKGVQANTYLEDEPVYTQSAEVEAPLYTDEAEVEEAEAEPDFSDTFEVDGDDEEYSHEAVEPFIGEIEDDSSTAEERDDIGELEEAAEQEAPQEASSGTQTGDVIGEAEIYIAYGRYGQAANLLSGVLGSEPDRWDVRLKLMEVYVESHDEDSFNTHAQYIVDHCDDEDVLLACRELEGQMESGHVDMSGDTAGAEDDLGLASGGDNAEGDGGDAQDDFDLDLDDFESAGSSSENEDSAELELDEILEVGDDEVAEAADSEADKGIDFELEFDDLEESSDANEASEVEAVANPADDNGSGDELGGDLGIDFDPDKEASDDVAAAVDDAQDSTSAEASESADEFDLDAIISDVDAADDEQDVTQGLPSPSTADEADDFEFEGDGDGDINATKLDLAEAYVDMGDADGAQDILKEVLEEGTPEQQQKAQEMLDGLAS